MNWYNKIKISEMNWNRIYNKRKKELKRELTPDEIGNIDKNQLILDSVKEDRKKKNEKRTPVLV
jgi:hypothetical protein